MDWIILVEKRIANIGIPLDVIFFGHFNDLCVLKNISGLWVFADQPTVHIGGVSRVGGGGGGSVAVAVGVSDRWQVTGDR